MTSRSPYSEHFFVPEALNNSWSNMYHYIPMNARVLDVGCSTGNFGEALERLKGCTVVGVDINEEDIAEARGRISAAHVFDITSPGAKELLGTFDVVVFADVIEHLGNPRAALSAVHELLAEGGILVYSIPNMAHLSVRIDLLEGRFPYAELGLLDRTHLHFYDRLEVHNVLSSSGYTITDERPTISDFPERWTAQRLSAIGLSATSGFFDMLRASDAHIYQYVGAAAPRSGVALSPPESSKFVAPPDELLDRANRAIIENERLERELSELRAWLVNLKKRPILFALAAVRRRLPTRHRVTTR